MMLQQSSRGSLCKCKDRDRERKGSFEDPKESERRLREKEEGGVLAAFLKKKLWPDRQGLRVQAREPTAE